MLLITVLIKKALIIVFLCIETYLQKSIYINVYLKESYENQ